ncbi:MAG: hypothetical protein ACI9WS_002231 [Paraglaciecola psychrophila]|jgi:hypothetical protein
MGEALFGECRQEIGLRNAHTKYRCFSADTMLAVQQHHINKRLALSGHVTNAKF